MFSLFFFLKIFYQFVSFIFGSHSLFPFPLISYLSFFLHTRLLFFTQHSPPNDLSRPPPKFFQSVVQRFSIILIKFVH